MNRKPVTSSNIVSVGHDPATETLEIEFKGGGVYTYSGVSVEKHSDFINADSIGSHFHKHIRSAHAGTKADQ